MRAKLQMAGLSPNAQRLALCRLLFMSGDRHATGEMLWREARAMGLPLTPKTITAGLRQFAEAKLLREVALYGATVWYDTNTGAHCHFYDEETGMLYDMPEHVMPRFELPPSEGIDVVGVDLIVRIRRRSGG
jgi:Fur family iron response transcriptional regulator